MLPRDYSLRDIPKALTDPSLFVSAGLDIIEHGIYVPIRNWAFQAYHGDGVEVMAEDWDVLILLDAARYEEFAELNTIDGDLEPRLSKGGYSEEFIQKNFAGGEFHDTVYVTGNPYALDLDDGVFHDLIMVEIGPVGDPLGPDDEQNFAVRPEDVLRETLAARERYPNKRLIVHFIQPHLPYIGEKGREIYRRGLHERAEKGLEDDELHNPGTKGYPLNPCAAARHEEMSITDDDIREAYREDLAIALEYAEELIEAVPGKAVVSADHGELLGERYVTPQYGHPHHIRVPELYIVPWLVVDDDERPQIEAEPPETADDLETEELEEQLSALGYT